MIAAIALAYMTAGAAYRRANLAYVELSVIRESIDKTAVRARIASLKATWRANPWKSGGPLRYVLTGVLVGGVELAITLSLVGFAVVAVIANSVERLGQSLDRFSL